MQSIQKSNPHEIHLQEWDECVGTYKGMEIGEFETIVVLSRTHDDDLRIGFPTASPEVDILKKELGNELLGHKISIIRTDNCQHPILIRKVEGQGLDRDAEVGVNKSV